MGNALQRCRDRRHKRERMEAPEQKEAIEESERMACLPETSSLKDMLVMLAVFGYLFAVMTPFVWLFFGLIYLEPDRRGPVFGSLALYVVLASLPHWLHRALPTTLVRGYVLPCFLAVELLPHGRFWPLTAAAVIAFNLMRSALAYSVRAEPPTKNGRLRILMAGDSFYPKVDGVATFTTKSIKHMIKEGHRVHVLYSKAGPETIFGAEVTRLPGIAHSMCPEHSLTMPFPHLVLRTLMRVKPHIVHMFESGCVFNLFMIMYCWFLDIPTVMSHHTRVDKYSEHAVPFCPHWIAIGGIRAYYRLLIQLNTLNITVAKAFLRRGGLLRWSQLPTGLAPKFWRTGTDVNNFDPNNYRQQVRENLSGGCPDLPLVLHVGRIAGEKQSNELPGVFRRVFHALEGKVRFVVIGGGPLSEEVVGRLKADLGDAVQCPGFMHGDDLYQAYASSDVFFSPSAAETFPLVYVFLCTMGLRRGLPGGFLLVFFFLFCFSFSQRTPNDETLCSRTLAVVTRPPHTP